MSSSNQRQGYRILANIPLEVSFVPDDKRVNLYSEVIDDILPGPAPTPRAIDENSKDPLEWMRTINQKLDVLIYLLQTGNKTPAIAARQQVSFSSSGIAFDTKETLKPGDVLEMKTTLIIMKKPVRFRLFGRVVNVSLGAKKSKVAVKFMNISEDVQNKLASFVFEREQDFLGRENS